MSVTLIAAMALSMAAQDTSSFKSQEGAKECASHYMAIGTIVGAVNLKDDASETEKDAAIGLAMPWYMRAADVLKTAGVPVPEGELFPESVQQNSSAMIDKIIDGTTSAEQAIGTVVSCDQAYGFEMLEIASPSQ